MLAVDVFSGPGGLTLGLKRAGIQPIVAVEFVKDASETNRLHSPEIEHINQDIRDVSFKRFKTVADIVYGGPPCQPFSLGGLRKGKEDSRDMIPEFVRTLSEVNPGYFIMENVPGLTMKKAHPYFIRILMDLAELGYFVSWEVLNSADYGIPQKRKRLFVIGSKNRYLTFPIKTHGSEENPHVACGDIILEGIGEPANSPVKYARNPDLRKSPYAGHLYNGGGRPIDPEAPCHTILASSGGHKTHWVDTLGIAVEYHNHLMKGGQPREGVVGGARRLSVEECALIQTFPKDMKFVGSRSSQYTQIGDAVPPRFAEILGTHLMAQIKDDNVIGEKGNIVSKTKQLEIRYA